MTDIEKALDGRYRIERELGRGGMGAVYLARDLKLDRPVALKVLPPEFGTNAALRERFLRETRTAASFSHPNIVPVHAVEEHDGVLAFAMGFVEGESVAARVKRQGPLDSRAVARMLTDVAYALAYAHGRGVVHRDIKPDNIMIERATGRALLMDFGISRTISAPTDSAGPGVARPQPVPDVAGRAVVPHRLARWIRPLVPAAGVEGPNAGRHGVNRYDRTTVTCPGDSCCSYGEWDDDGRPGQANSRIGGVAVLRTYEDSLNVTAKTSGQRVLAGAAKPRTGRGIPVAALGVSAAPRDQMVDERVYVSSNRTPNL